MQLKTSGRSDCPVATLSAFHVAPPSVVLNAPAALMPMFILFGSSASIAIECRPRPPAPGFHFGREGCSSRLRIHCHVSPRSSLLNSAAGSTPAQTTFGVFAWPGSMFQVWPRSRLYSTREPPQVELIAAYIEPSRGSYEA